MSRSITARLAGFTFLFYIAVALPSVVLVSRSTRGLDTAGRLANVSGHVTELQVSILLVLLSCFSALVLAITLHALTRQSCPELALVTLVCRASEAVLGVLGIPKLVQLMALVPQGQGFGGMDPAVTNTIASYLLMPGQGVMLGAPFFAVGSLAFSLSLLREGWVPRLLSWLGVAASTILVIGLPLVLSGFLRGWISAALWMPMLAFEVPLGLWWLVKGAPEAPVSPSRC